MKERREPWYWSDTDVDPWSRRGYQLVNSLGLIFFTLAFAPIGLMIGRALPSGTALPSVDLVLFGCFAFAVSIVLIIIIHEIGHLIAGLREGFSLSYLGFAGLEYDFKKRKFGPSLMFRGAMGGVVFEKADRTSPGYRRMMMAGVAANLATIPFGLLLVFWPDASPYPRLMGVIFALTSLYLAIVNLIPFRVSPNLVTDGYWLKWLKEIPAEARLQPDWPEHLVSLYERPAHEWDMAAIDQEFSDPAHTPFRRYLRYLHETDPQDSIDRGLKLESLLAKWPRGRPNQLTFAVLAEAAVFFSSSVNDPVRASHYTNLIKQNLASPQTTLLPIEIAKLKLDGRHQQAENKAKIYRKTFQSLPPALVQASEARIQEILRPARPPMPVQAQS